MFARSIAAIEKVIEQISLANSLEADDAHTQAPSAHYHSESGASPGAGGRRVATGRDMCLGRSDTFHE